MIAFPVLSDNCMRPLLVIIWRKIMMRHLYETLIKLWVTSKLPAASSATMSCSSEVTHRTLKRRDNQHSFGAHMNLRWKSWFLAFLEECSFKPLQKNGREWHGAIGSLNEKTHCIHLSLGKIMHIINPKIDSMHLFQIIDFLDFFFMKSFKRVNT